MDKRPLNSDRTREDKRFAEAIARYDHLAEQINDGLHDGDEECEPADLQRALELVGITLRSCDGSELLGIFGQLDIDLQQLLSAEGTSISELFDHEHSELRLMTEPVTEDLPVWSVKCRRCGAGRKVVRD
jgi:hypothetical protein